LFLNDGSNLAGTGDRKGMINMFRTDVSGRPIIFLGASSIPLQAQGYAKDGI